MKIIWTNSRTQLIVFWTQLCMSSTPNKMCCWSGIGIVTFCIKLYYWYFYHKKVFLFIHIVFVSDFIICPCLGHYQVLQPQFRADLGKTAVKKWFHASQNPNIRIRDLATGCRLSSFPGLCKQLKINSNVAIFLYHFNYVHNYVFLCNLCNGSRLI